MGRILYGVKGDHGGHVSRSLAIARQLNGHEIVFVGGDRALELAQHGYAIVSVPDLGTRLSGQRVDVSGTVLHAASVFARQPSTVKYLTALIEDFDPDLIVTDYEYFLPLAARRCGRACVSVDRQHAMTHCRYRVPSGHRLSRALTLGCVQVLYTMASHYLVTSFVPMQPIDPGLTEVFPAVLREAVTAIRPSPGEHAVVYLQGTSLDWVRALLGGRRRRYIIYGFDRTGEEGNLSFRQRASDAFLNDLASCSYVISHGGHNVISEALHYGKPLLCFPMRLLYEQLLNAHLLAEAGYGAYHEADAGARAALDAFEAGLAQFQRATANFAPWDNRTVASRLEELIASRGSIGPASCG
jgi:uncharacterized protein (TIGR00661 family)